MTKKSACQERDRLKELLEKVDNDTMMRGLLEQFYFNCKVKNLSEKTMSVYGERLGHFHGFLKSNRILFDQVSKETIQQYILSMKGRVSDHTVNGRLRVLKTFFKFLSSEGLSNNGNPLDRIQYIRVERKLKPVLSAEQVEQLLHFANYRKSFYCSRNKAMILLFWDSLIRLSELINIRKDDVDFKSGSLKVLGKGRKERICPLGAKTLKTLHAYCLLYRNKIEGDYFFCLKNGRPLERRHVERILERIGKKAGIKVSPHLLRHSAASHLALSGIPAFMLQRLLGHTSLNTTQIYIHLIDDQKLKQVFQKYSPGDYLRV